jgi:hypothetical protein
VSGRLRIGAAPSEAIAAVRVRFPPGPQALAPIATPAPTGRLPRVARLLALAHRIDGMICSGEIRDWADAARLAGITRARMTQIANLALLAPDLQEMILSRDGSEANPGRELLTERALRRIDVRDAWSKQIQSAIVALGTSTGSFRGRHS